MRNDDVSELMEIFCVVLFTCTRPNQPTECRLIFAFVLLENLKESFARSRSIPYVKGFFRVSIAAKARAYKFEELLDLMLKDVGMRRGLKRIVKIRNEIVHSGLYLRPHSKRWAAYERIHDLLREYVLRLLGYHGDYLTYTSASNSSAKLWNLEQGVSGCQGREKKRANLDRSHGTLQRYPYARQSGLFSA